jgi:hypothetical protein
MARIMVQSYMAVGPALPYCQRRRKPSHRSMGVCWWPILCSSTKLETVVSSSWSLSLVARTLQSRLLRRKLSLATSPVAGCFKFPGSFPTKSSPKPGAPTRMSMQAGLSRVPVSTFRICACATIQSFAPRQLTATIARV